MWGRGFGRFGRGRGWCWFAGFQGFGPGLGMGFGRGWFAWGMDPELEKMWIRQRLAWLRQIEQMLEDRLRVLEGETKT